MRTLLPCWFAALALTGCVVGDESADTPPGTASETAQVGTFALDEPAGDAPGPADDPCDFLPPDGPCSVACDHDALESYVPPGSCAVFACELTNGETLEAHACRPPA